MAFRKKKAFVNSSRALWIFSMRIEKAAAKYLFGLVLFSVLFIAVARIVIRWDHCPVLFARGDAIYDATVAREMRAGHGLRTNLMPLGGLGVLIRQGHQNENP